MLNVLFSVPLPNGVQVKVGIPIQHKGFRQSPSPHRRILPKNDPFVKGVLGGEVKSGRNNLEFWFFRYFGVTERAKEKTLHFWRVFVVSYDHLPVGAGSKRS